MVGWVTGLAVGFSCFVGLGDGECVVGAAEVGCVGLVVSPETGVSVTKCVGVLVSPLVVGEAEVGCVGLFVSAAAGDSETTCVGVLVSPLVVGEADVGREVPMPGVVGDEENTKLGDLVTTSVGEVES